MGLGALALGSACSLEGLDRFPFPTCNADGHTGCEPLNARDGITDPQACMLWQCDTAGRYCTFGPRDSDGDTFVALRCGGTDCEDDVASAHPGATESCDGADNDCNGLVDDIDVAHPPAAIDPAVVLTGVSAPSFVDLADAADGFFAVWDASGQTRNALVTQTARETPSTELFGTTNAHPDRGLLESTSASGCPDVTLVPLGPTPCATTGPPCLGAQVCVTAPDSSRICEAAVVHNSPEHAGECQTNAECSDGIACNGEEPCQPTGGATLIDARGCRLQAENTTPCAGVGVCLESVPACAQPLVAACDFREMGSAYAGGGDVMTLAVTFDRCGAGRVRPGLVSTTDAPPSDILWGGQMVSTTWDGVDIGDDGCTGASRASGDPHGGEGPTLVVLPRDPTIGRDVTEALAAWIALPLGTAVPGPVEILGLWREQMTIRSETVRFVDASDDGRPLRLADSSTSAHVGLASYARQADAGYLVAYGRMGGGVSVSTVPHLGAPAVACPAAGACITRDPGADTFVGTLDDGNPSTTIQTVTPQPPRTTPALGTPTSITLDATATVVGDVSVAVGVPEPTTPAPTTLPVALAWATAAEITIALARVDPATHVLTDGSRLHIAAMGVRDVRIVHVEAGVSLAGQFAGGTIDAAETGGFVVTWVTSAGTAAARISDHTHDLIAPGAILLGGPSDEPLAFVDYDDAGGNPRVRVAAHQADGIVVFPNVCGPPPP